MTVEQKAEEYTNKELTTEVPYGDQNIKYISESDVIQAFIDGYHECQKEHEWHYVKDGDYPKEKGNYLVAWERTHHVEEFGKWGFDVDLFNVDEGYFEGDGDYVVAWKEIVLPELPKENK